MTASEFHARLFGAAGAITIEDAVELRGVVEGLLRDDSARRAVAVAGRRAVAAGTYRARMRELIAMLGGAECSMHP
jgi:hypothetical protein